MKRYLWMFTALGLLTAAMSTFQLLIFSLNVGISMVFDLLIRYYNVYIGVLLDWLKGPIEYIFSPIAHLFNISLHLMPHWRHVFIVMSLCLGANVRAEWAVGNKVFSVFLGVVGGVIALVATVFSGITSLDTVLGSEIFLSFELWLFGNINQTLASIISKILDSLEYIPIVALFPAAGMAIIYAIIFAHKSYSSRVDLSPQLFLFLSVPIAVSALLMILIYAPFFLAIQFFGQDESIASSSGVLMLIVAALSLGVVQIYIGIKYDYYYYTYNDDRNVVENMLSVRGIAVGSYIISAMLGAIIFLMTNAGLSFLGL